MKKFSKWISSVLSSLEFVLLRIAIFALFLAGLWTVLQSLWKG
jgi:hypothetical protein